MLILIGLLVLAVSGVVRYLADGNLEAGWCNNVLRNWEQYGFLTLHGKLVTNPGGVDALTKPDVYTGHRSASLYPAFFVMRLFAWTGAGVLAFQVVLGLIVWHSIWFLLGKSRVAWLAGAAAILCPGYGYLGTNLDPSVVPLLMGLPFAAIILPRLGRPSLSLSAFAVFFLATVAYTTLNWITVFTHGMLLAYLIAAREIPRRRAGLYIALAGVSLLLVAGMSVLEKRGAGTSLTDFLGGYTWGSGGYGTYLTLGRAATRLLFVGVAGLLPLVLLCGYVLARHPRSSSPNPWIAFAPLGMAVLGVAAMRNYFGHHPWVAASPFLVGLILSMRLVLQGREATSPVKEPLLGGKALVPAIFLVGCFVYGAALTTLANLRNAESYALLTMVRAHTARSDALVLMKADPSLASIAAGLAEHGDRKVLVLNDLATVEHSGGRAFLVSTADNLRLPLVAKTSESSIASWPLVQQMLSFYSTKVARRMPGNQGLKPGTCYLYELKNNKSAAAGPTALNGYSN